MGLKDRRQRIVLAAVVDEQYFPAAATRLRNETVEDRRHPGHERADGLLLVLDRDDQRKDRRGPRHQANTQRRLRAKVSNGVTKMIGTTGHQVGPSHCFTSSHTKNWLATKPMMLTVKKRAVRAASLSREP